MAVGKLTGQWVCARGADTNGHHTQPRHGNDGGRDAGADVRRREGVWTQIFEDTMYVRVMGMVAIARRR